MDKNKSGKFYVLWHFNWLLWHLWSWFRKSQHGEAYVGEAYIPGEHFPARWRPLLNGCSLLVVAKLLRTCSPESERLQKKKETLVNVILFFCYCFFIFNFLFPFFSPFPFPDFFPSFPVFPLLVFFVGWLDTAPGYFSLITFSQKYSWKRANIDFLWSMALLHCQHLQRLYLTSFIYFNIEYENQCTF